MSKRFLTPVNLPHGTNLPAVGSAGDLFYRTFDNKVYAHNGTSWEIGQGSGSGSSTISELTDVSLFNLQDTEILQYSAANSKWINVNLVSILYELGAISGSAGSPSTTTTAGTIDGGAPGTTVWTAIYDGGSAGSI